MAHRIEPHSATATAPWSTWLVPIALAGMGALAWACQDGLDDAGASASDAGDLVGAGETSRADVLASIAHEVIVPHTAAFAESSDALVTAVRDYAAVATDASAREDALADAREAWRSAARQWQALEVMQVGPAASSLVGIGGEDLRDAIYSWPTVDTCVVDRAIADGSYAADDFFTTQLVWAYGLDALEYLLFVDGTAHSCPAQVQLDGPWGALSEDELWRRRAEYATILAEGIAERAATLATRWSPEGDDFAAALANAGEEASPFASEVEALDEVFRAMFYIDLEAKDGKLGLPLGLIEGCASVPCVELMEAPWSGEAAPAIAANLRALQELIQGGVDPETADGFDDLLVEAGHEDVATTLHDELAAAIELAESLDQPMQTLATTDADRVTALHQAIKRVSDTLEGPFVMALMLSIPAEGAGDND